MFELSKQFRFESAHTLERAIDAAPSRRIHGHSYRAEVTVRGARYDPKTGMVMDLGVYLNAPSVMCTMGLDHRLLDDVADLGPSHPRKSVRHGYGGSYRPSRPGLARVTVYRDSNGESCSFSVHNRLKTRFHFLLWDSLRDEAQKTCVEVRGFTTSGCDFLDLS